MGQHEFINLAELNKPELIENNLIFLKKHFKELKKCGILMPIASIDDFGESLNSKNYNLLESLFSEMNTSFSFPTLKFNTISEIIAFLRG